MYLKVPGQGSPKMELSTGTSQRFLFEHLKAEIIDIRSFNQTLNLGKYVCYFVRKRYASIDSINNKKREKKVKMCNTKASLTNF
jgi:hypothetical protein